MAVGQNLAMLQADDATMLKRSFYVGSNFFEHEGKRGNYEGNLFHSRLSRVFGQDGGRFAAGNGSGGAA